MRFFSLIFSLFTIIFLVIPMLAAEISPTAQLRRASLLLRGKVPSQADYTEVLNSQQPSVTIENKVQGYLKSPEFLIKMRVRLQELFRVKQSMELNTQQIPNIKEVGVGSESTNALDQLFLMILSENLSWDNLLVGKKYRFRGAGNNSSNSTLFVSDLEFFKPVFSAEIGHISPLSTDLVEVEGKSREQINQLAGALTTSRFFSRNQTTKVNKNRRRSAAIFRTFLCDDLKPVILPDAEEDKGLLALAVTGKAKDEEVLVAKHAQQHASDPRCQSCHYKLDPLANVFRGSSYVLNKKSASGALVFRRKNGTLVNIPVASIAQLGEAITKQPEYAECQVRHFWNWFIGKDVPVSPKRLVSLVAEFNAVGRRPMDFIKKLVLSPEFRTVPNPNQEVTFSYVEPVIQACNQCHVNKNFKNKAPDLGKYPFSDMAIDNRQMIKDLTKSIDLSGNGRLRTMPPPDAGWNLSLADYDALRVWISQGARDEANNSHIEHQEINSLLPIDQQKNKLNFKPSFDDTYYRYLAGYDFDLVISSLFSKTQNPIYLSDFRAKGFKNPSIGAPYLSNPNAYTVNLIVATAERYVNDFNSIPDLKKLLNPNEDFKNWKEIPEARQIQLVQNAISFAIGPKVLGSEKESRLIAKIQKALRKQKAPGNLIVYEQLKRIVFLVIISEEFQII